MTPADRLSTALADKYRIERELGQGGMATVYLAEDLRHGRKVAVKVLLPELAAVLGAERFLSEIHVTAALQHPHILPLFDSGQVEGQLFYVMPYVEGESLRSRLERERQLPLDDAMRIAHEVASALGYAHRHGIIHRDIKPENILLHDGHAVVADFGIALAVTTAGGGRLTQTGLSLGTPQYMSPEQATGEREIDARSDIYSLAAVTYEMLGGEPPHTGNTMQAVIARMLTERPRNIRTVRPSVPDHVASALDVALERIPADRWNSIDEFERALDGKLTRAARTGATPVSTAQQAVTTGWRARLKDPLTLALAALVVIASTIAAISVVRKPASRELQTARFLITLPHGTQFSSSSQNALAISPNGRLIAFTAHDSVSSSRIYLRSIDDTHATPVAGTDAAFNLWFSPDGRWIGFVQSDGMRKMLVSTREIVNVAPFHGIYGGATWTTRGEIVMSTNNSRLYVIPENGGPERLVCGKSGDSLIFQIGPLAMPDGDHVLFAGGKTSALAGSKLGVASLRTGECRLLDVLALQPIGVTNGVVTFATLSGVIMAAPFDEHSLELKGKAIPVISDVDVNQTTGAAQAAMSNNGSLVYFTANTQSNIVKVDAAGKSQPIIPEPRTYAYPRYSPDGSRIAVAVATTGQRDIWVIDVANGTMSQLTSGHGINDRPEWSPDGKRILYRNGSKTRSSILWRSVDLSDEESPLLSNDKEDFYEGVITPDGSSIVYQRDTAGADVMIQPLSGNRTPRAIANSQYAESMGRVSPDGKWVAYTSDASGSLEVFVQPLPGPGPRVQVSTHGGDEPVWSHNGQKLFYRDGQNLVGVSIITNPTFRITGRANVFPDVFAKRFLPHANFDVSPDGSSFLFLKGSVDPEAVVVYNWISEIQSRLRDAAGKQ